MGQLDKFEPWRFGPIRLAIESASVKIGVRRAEHVYPHTAGAAGEKMGRKLYVISASGKFDDGLSDIKDYENHLTQAGIFRMLVEEETTEDLTIPWIGKVKAQCLELDLNEKNTNRSGLGFSAEFVEDLDFEFPIQNFVKVNKLPMLDAAIKFEDHAWKADIFSKIAAGVGKILGIKDQFELYSALVRSKIDYLEGLFREADEISSELKDPANILALSAFAELWETLRSFGNDIANKGLEFRFYTVPIQMTLQQLSSAIYSGDGTRGGDLLGLNIIDDPLIIPAGMSIRYYDEQS
jgi:hypothetical protein